MKNNKSGFAFIPILIGLCMLIAGVGVGTVITKKYYSVPLESNIVNAVDQDISEVELDDTSEEDVDGQSEIMSDSNSLDEELSQTIKQTPQSKQVADIVTSTNEPKSIFEEPVAITNQVSVMKDEVASVSDTSSEDEFVQDELLKTSYDKTKTESRNLTEGIEFVENRYKELLALRDRGLVLCKNSYDMDISPAKSQADSLKQSYLESRAGYATQPSVTNDIDRALEIDLAYIEDEYEICKSQYTVDSSVVGDIKVIKSEQSNIITRLTLESAVSSLENILSLHKKLLTVADKLR